MALSIQMAFRNLLRRPLRSVLTGTMIVIGTTLAVWMMGQAQGSYDLMIDGTTRGWIGHFQVLDPEYHDSASLYDTVDEPATLLEDLREVEGVQGVTARIETGGLIAAENRTVGALVIGVDPIHEARTSTLGRNISDGEWLTPGEVGESENYPIIIGRGVANRLAVSVGAEVSFVGQAADGSIAAELFTVVGIYDSGSRSADRSLALIRLERAQELLALEGRVHRIVGTLDDSRSLASVMGELPRPEEYLVADWMELNPMLWQLIEADRNSSRIMLWIIIAVVVIGVANTMAMSVFERTRELGVMLALGTGPRQVVAVVLWEVAWLSGLGVLIGIGLGALAVEYTRIPLPEPLEMGGVVFTHLTGSNTWAWTVLNPLLVIVASLVSGLYAARRAALLNPVDAIRGRH
ncbi:MAG: FtsX-like permease family protein [Myxococcota bacterium]